MDTDPSKGCHSLRLAITGATGFIGYNLVKCLSSDKQYHIRCLIRKESDSSRLESLGTEIHLGDIRDKKDVKNFLHDIDAVIHLAAVKQHYQDKNLVISTNIEGTKNLVDNSKNLKHFIFASSTLVINPIDKYAQSKKECERIITESGTNYTILRIGPVFGPGDSTNITRIILALKTGKSIPIPGNGNQIFQPTFIGDVVKSIKSLILNEKLFNKTCVVTGNPTSLNEFIDTVEKILNHKNKKFHIPNNILKFAIRAYQVVSSNPTLTIEQLENLNSGHLTILNSDFPISPLLDCVKKTIKESQP